MGVWKLVYKNGFGRAEVEHPQKLNPGPDPTLDDSVLVV
jgi:hypothetical protein